MRSRYDAALSRLVPARERLEATGGDATERAAVAAKIGWSLSYLGRYPEAVGTFAQATRLAPDWYGLHNGLGWSYLKLGRKAEAQAAFERALSPRPGYGDAQEGLRLARG